MNAPVDEVFPFFANYDTFSTFMANVHEVRDLGQGRSHWVARGPAGIPVSWNAVLTQFEPNEVIAWRSEPGSLIANAGRIRFEPDPGGRTRVSVCLTYNPPGGALGHVAASLFGADPRSSLNDDLVRLKSLIEDGCTSAPGGKHAARVDVVEATEVVATAEVGPLGTMTL